MSNTMIHRTPTGSMTHSDTSPHHGLRESAVTVRSGNGGASSMNGSQQTQHATANGTMSTHQLDELAQALQFSVDIADRKCKKTRQKFQDVFVGNEAVEIIQQLARLESREDAITMGRLLQVTMNLFECVNTPKHQQLEDDKRLFYQFTSKASPTEGNRGKTEELVKNLEEKMRVFQRGVRVKDRSYRLTTYKQCFVGKEAVDLMMRHKMAGSRQECVEIGRILKARYNLFLPMTGAHDFEDDAYKFYRLLLPQKEKVKTPSFFDEIKPAAPLILLSLIPAIVIYYLFY